MVCQASSNTDDADRAYRFASVMLVSIVTTTNPTRTVMTPG